MNCINWYSVWVSQWEAPARDGQGRWRSGYFFSCDFHFLVYYPDGAYIPLLLLLLFSDPSSITPAPIKVQWHHFLSLALQMTGTIIFLILFIPGCLTSLGDSLIVPTTLRKSLHSVSFKSQLPDISLTGIIELDILCLHKSNNINIWYIMTGKHKVLWNRTEKCLT